ncbi:MAG: LysR family transcriptional regulator [Deltaproteobacteria bacterium]|nr:MAG: LysR family transcriptional regulator [Deltaproteobacteria bacterium]
MSYAVAHLEDALGVALFDRAGRRPALTAAGKALLADTRAVLAAVSALGARAEALAGRRAEPEVGVAVDAIVPASWLVALGRAFQQRFPEVTLRIRTEVVEAVPALVRDRAVHVGIGGPFDTGDDPLRRRPVGTAAIVAVAAPDHPLSRARAPLARAEVGDAVQIVIAQRAGAGRDHSVLSATTWRVADAATKLALIRAGLGWGTLPYELVADDLAAGRLVALHIEEWGPKPRPVDLFVFARSDRALGPAARWVWESLPALCAEAG